ncbi:MAG TPA: glycosyltransferase [Acidimicrobiales bacterium]|nr:glycosyltransferase [Acidimicrobiales bacterium]
MSEPSRKGRIVAVVPAKDREDSVGATVGALAALPTVDDVLVVDDGSSDDTAEAARRAGAWVLRLPENLGKGGAVAAAVQATPETDVYLLVDADTGASAAAAEALLGPVLAGEADMTVAVLPAAGGRGGFGLVRDLAGAGIRRGANGFRAQAPLSGQRAVRGQLLRSLDLAPRFGLEVGLTVDAVQAGARVVEVPVAMEHRHTGRSVAGFAHRGRQGVDAARALWPRLTSRRARAGLIVVALLLAMAAAGWSGAAAPPASVAATGEADKVLLVGVPGLAWDDLGSGTLPNLDALVAGGAVGAMNVRTSSARPSVGEGYATLGAGSRVKVGNAADDAVAVEGWVVVPGAASVRAGAGRHLATRPGSLGDALHAAGRRTGVVGNADLAPGLAGVHAAGHPNLSRPTAVALMDGAGVVDTGSVTPEDLLATADLAPFRRMADVAAVEARTRAALAAADVVLVDPGDLDRSAALTSVDAPDFYVGRTRSAALAEVDDLLGRLRAGPGLPPRTLVLVVSVTPPGDEWRLAPVVAWGSGVVPGRLTSPSTRRSGLVTLTDVAPTVLAALGAPVPAAMPGRAMRYTPGGAGGIGGLSRLDRDAAWRERVWLPVTTGFIVAQVGLWFVTGAAVAGRAPWLRRPWLRAGAVGVAAFPAAALLLRALPFVPALGSLGGVAVLVVLDLALAALALQARRHLLAPLAWLFAGTVALLVADVATGAHLQLAGLLGYSPQSASRFFGLGNTAFGVLAAAAVLVAAIHVDRAPRRREAVLGAAALLALVAFVDGAPFLGADVGGLLALVPISALVVWVLSGRGLTWRTVVAAGGVTALVLGVATAVDLLRPPASRTHLGRLAAQTLHSGDGGLVDTVSRKVEVNLGGVGQSFWTAVTPVIAVALLVALVYTGWGRRLAPPGSPVRAGLLGALAAGLIGFAVNDSGVIVVAMALVEVGPVVALLALADPPGRPILLEPVPEPAGAARG